VGVDLDYYVDPATGFVKSMAPVSTIPGDGVQSRGYP